MVRASNLNQLTNAYVVFYELLPSSAHHINSLHSSSPGLASTTSSSTSSSPRKLIGPQLPPNHLSQNKTSSNQNHVLSSAVTSNIDVDKITNGGKFNNNNNNISSSKPGVSSVVRRTVPPPLPPANKPSLLFPLPYHLPTNHLYCSTESDRRRRLSTAPNWYKMALAAPSRAQN
uniref:Uncharacterized protein n=1 Tax=Cacopsylla melanoneura TaxID=428564 RepID=A0A8D8YEQ5_9HEMI